MDLCNQGIGRSKLGSGQCEERSIYLTIYLSIYLFVIICLSIYLSTCSGRVAEAHKQSAGMGTNLSRAEQVLTGVLTHDTVDLLAFSQGVWLI